MMGSTSIEIRQPYSLPQTVNVPNYPRLAELEARLRELNKEAKRATSEYETALAEATKKRVESELSEWRQQFGWQLYRRNNLTAELEQAAKPMEIRGLLPGERPRRNRLEILVDLEQAVQWLAIWSGDPDLAEETARVKAQLAEARSNHE